MAVDTLLSPERIYYHIKALQNAGLVGQVGERRVRGTVEGSYQARAGSYWLASDLAGQVTRGPFLVGPMFAFAIALSRMSLLGLGALSWALVLGAGISFVLEWEVWQR